MMNSAVRTFGLVPVFACGPYTRATGHCDVVIRYLDEKGLRCRYTMLINGAARGDAWMSAGEGRGWRSHTLHGEEVRTGDEIRVDADGALGRPDYVQFDFVEP